VPRLSLRSTGFSALVIAASLLLALIASAGVATSAHAQPPPLATNRIFLPVALRTTLLAPPTFENWAYYRTSQVLAVALDEPNGVVWGGTDAGLVRWDRRSGARDTFTTRDGLAADRVTDVALDADGSVWLAHDDLLGGSTNPAGGAGVSHRSTLGNWSRVTTADGLASNVVYAIEQAPDGAMWFGTIDGASQRSQAGTWTSFRPPGVTAQGLGWNSFLSLAFDATGNLWLGNAHGVSRRAADGTWQWNEDAIGGPISAIDVDEQGGAWCANPDVDGVTVLRPNGSGPSGRLTLTRSNGLHSPWIDALALDRAGNRWFASYDGISRLAADGQTWSYRLDPNTFATLGIQDLVIDIAGQPWIATLGHVQGLGDDGIWRALDTAVKLGSNQVSDIVFDAAGRPWISTMASGIAPGGISTVGGEGVWTFIEPVVEAHPGEVTSRGYHVPDLALDHDGSLWMATNAGAVRRTPDGRWTHYTQRSGLATDDVRAVEVDRQGNVWFANSADGGEGGAGLSKLSPIGAWEYFTTANGLTSDSVGTIAVNRRGDRWFGHYDTISILTAEGAWQQPLGLDPNMYVNAIVFDHADNAWIGTGAGVIRRSADGRTSTRFTKAEGLPSDDVRAIEVDPLGQVWLGTSAGAARQAPNDRFSAVVIPGQTPTKAFAWNQLSAIAFSPRGEAWFGSIEGVTVLR
jgi:ligand-binding sensor domain-containing protein